MRYWFEGQIWKRESRFGKRKVRKIAYLGLKMDKVFKELAAHPYPILLEVHSPTPPPGPKMWLGR